MRARRLLDLSRFAGFSAIFALVACDAAVGSIGDPLGGNTKHHWPSQGNGGGGDEDGGAPDPGGAPTPPSHDASAPETDPVAPPPPPPDDGGAPPVVVDAGPSSPDTAPPSIDSGPPSPPPPTTYPSGPYGYATGNVFPNVTLNGYVDGSGAWTTISMQSYYDPDGSRKINAIYVDVSASWCGACQSESADLPTIAGTYKPRGTKFLTALIQDTSSAPASESTVDAWQGSYHLPFDVAADPSEDLLPKGGVGLPHNYLIDPRTMQVVQVIEGYDGSSGIPGLDSLLSKNGG